MRSFSASILMLAVVTLSSACGGSGAGKQAVRWADETARAIRGADEAAEAKQATRRVPPAVADESAARLRQILDDAWDDVLCDGAEIIANALKAGQPTNFDWRPWVSEGLDPRLESDFSDDEIDDVGDALASVLDALETNTAALEGVADACNLATSL
jgi:hypothetical protein